MAVSSGLAMNRAGQTLRLQCDQRVALTKSPDQAALDQCIFTDCDPASAGATLASGAAYYVMTIAPASLAEGKAPVSGLGNEIALCNSADNSEGSSFAFSCSSLAVDTRRESGAISFRSLLRACPEVAGSVAEFAAVATTGGKV